MAVSPVHDNASFARERSIRQSFSDIHRSPQRLLSNGSSNSSNDDNDNHENDELIEPHRESLLMRDRLCDKVQNNRCMFKPSPPARSHGTTPSSPRFQMRALPFTKDGSPMPQWASARAHIQRRYSPFTAKMAQEMMTKLIDEKRHEQRHVMKSRVANAYDNQNSSPNPQYLDENDGIQTMEARGKVLFKGYRIGEKLRSQSHMITEASSERGIEAVSTLNKHDFAFIKRSDGSYSYAILAYRSTKPIKGIPEVEECMTFVISSAGATKMIRKRHWSEIIHLVSTEVSDRHRAECPNMTNTHSVPKFSSPMDQHIKDYSVLLCQEIPPPGLCQVMKHEIGSVPPSMIEFFPQIDEECSLISNVSDRAMAQIRRARWQ